MQLSEPLSTTFNATDNGVNEVIAAVSGKYIRVYGIAITRTAGAGVLVVTGPGAKFRMGTVGSTICVLPIGDKPWLASDRGAALNVANGAGLDAAGVIVYRIED